MSRAGLWTDIVLMSEGRGHWDMTGLAFLGGGRSTLGLRGG